MSTDEIEGSVMAIRTTKDMFERELQKLYHAELEILDLHKDLAEAASSKSVKELFTGHKDDTIEQLERIESMFEVIDQPPRERGSQIMEGLLAEKDEFITEVENDALRDLDAIGIGMINEQFEIIILDRLLILATDLDLPDEIIEYLDANRTEAQAALQKMQEFTEQKRQRVRGR